MDKGKKASRLDASAYSRCEIHDDQGKFAGEIP